MTLSIKDPEASRLARQLAEQIGTTMTEAVIRALEEKLARQRQRAQRQHTVWREEVDAIVRRVSALPVRDSRSLEEMLYDEHGLPK